MSSRNAGGRGQRAPVLPPINQMFKNYQSGHRIHIWLFESLNFRIEGRILGFDEYMNLVVDDAVKVSTITKTERDETRTPLGRILLKGDNVSVMSDPNPNPS